MTNILPTRWLSILSALVLIISIPFLLFEREFESLVNSTLETPPGAVQLSALIAAALAMDVVLPIPSSIVNASAGALLGVAAGTFVCWFGMTLGCLFGYWIGATGGTLAVRKLLGQKELDRSAAIADDIAFGSLIVMRAVPVVAEASTIAAGIARLSLSRFLTVVSLANLGIAATYATVGAFALATNSFLLSFAAAVGIPVVAFGIHNAYQLVLKRISSVGAAVDTDVPAHTGIKLADTNADVDDNSVVRQRYSVTYEYPVTFTRGLFRPENQTLQRVFGAREGSKRHRCLVFLDSGVAKACSGLPGEIAGYFEWHDQTMLLVAPPRVIDGGEAVKDGFRHVLAIYETLQEHGIDRHSFVIAIGGGAVLDAVGFAAATAHRGIRHIRVPTTVLSQNDSGVGVKNAVNFAGVKNYAGTFAPPWAVLNDFDLLERLPRRARLEGISEAVKVALIRDQDFFLWLEANADHLAAFEPDAEEYMIRRSAQLHMNQIAHGGDPFETGSARPLDFGHWSAHKLESLTHHEVTHGEAVAIGIALDARYSVLAGLLAPGADERVAAVLERLRLRLWHPALEWRNRKGRLEILAGLEEFREHLGGELTVTLLSDLGTGVEVHEIRPELVAQAMQWLAAHEAA